jgi:hypothetical protein
MQKLFSVILGLLLLPSIASAHAGVSKRVGDVSVFLNQNPLSVFKDEPVNFVFSLVNSKHEALKQTDVEVTVVKNFTGDESRDEQVFSETRKTDENGVIEFAYSFPDESYYDVELRFKDPLSGADDETGFLVQVRENIVTQERSVKILLLAGALALGYLIGKRHDKIQTSN